MACISKIAYGISYDCDTGNSGFISALLINKEDIASITIQTDNPSWVGLLTLKEGAAAYKIDTVKRVLTTTEALKINEGAPNAFTHSATVVVTAPVVSALFKDLINPAANGSFVILTKIMKAGGSSTAADLARPFGLYYGMSATAIDRSSHDNGGWYTITMATPERVIGEDALLFHPGEYDKLYAAAIG